MVVNRALDLLFVFGLFLRGWLVKGEAISGVQKTSYPFTQTTCLISATTSTRSSWFFITFSIDL